MLLFNCNPSLRYTMLSASHAYCCKLCWVHMQNAAQEVGQDLVKHGHPWHSDRDRHSLHWSVRCDKAHFDDCSISFQILEHLLSRRSSGHPGALDAVPSSIVQEFLQRSYADVLRRVHFSVNSISEGIAVSLHSVTAAAASPLFDTMFSVVVFGSL